MTGANCRFTPDCGQFFEYFRIRGVKVANKLKGKMVNTASKSDFAREMSEMGFETESEDLKVAVWREKDQKFRMDTSNKFSMNALDKSKLSD